MTRVLVFIVTLCFFPISSSLAAIGDALTIKGDIVNLRTAPSSDADVAIKLSQGRKVIEIQRQGEWVEIETRRNDIKTGWVHASLLAKASAKPTTKPIATKTNKRFEHFMQGFNDYNEVIQKQNGAINFSKVKDKGDGTLEVIATEAWLDAPRGERERSLNKVFKLWSDVVPVGTSMSVIVLDEQGEQYMLMLR